MRFRPCIDIHNGKIKQIVGGSLKDEGDWAKENFVSEKDGDFYARFYEKDGLHGGHIILLNPASSPYYEDTRVQALLALRTSPGKWQVGGGISPENGESFLEAGASHVIVTSYVFQGGEIRMEHLEQMRQTVGREHLVLDVSCRKKGDAYYIVTDRWQKFTSVALTRKVLEELSSYCDEFLVHGVDVEGKASGVDLELIRLLGSYQGIPITYAGGIGSLEDLECIGREGRGKLDVTVGSALDLFGGPLPYRDILSFVENLQKVH